MARNAQLYPIQGSSALKAQTATRKPYVASFPEGVTHARRSYGVEGIALASHAARQNDRENVGTLAGRPLNLFSRVETVVSFALCSIVCIGVFFCF